MKEDVKDMLIDFSRGASLADKRELAEQLNVPYKWPSIEEQIVGKGHIGDYKKGRAKHPRLMYHVPGAVLENGLKMPGFVCHPDMAIPAIKELIRLAGIEDLACLVDTEGK